MPGSPPISTALPGTISVPSPTHVHANWVFTKPGVYTMTVHAASGSMRSATKTYTWRIGGDATAAPSSSASAEPSESPSASEEPSAPADDETVTPLPDPSVDPEDIAITLKSRCRHVALVTPPLDAIAE